MVYISDENQPLQSNRCSIPLGYQFDYLQEIAAQLGISDTSQALQVVILDHIRLIGLQGANTPAPKAITTSTEPKATPTQPGDDDLLAGMLPPIEI